MEVGLSFHWLELSTKSHGWACSLRLVLAQTQKQETGSRQGVTPIDSFFVSGLAPPLLLRHVVDCGMVYVNVTCVGGPASNSIRAGYASLVQRGGTSTISTVRGRGKRP